jgi:hypothetical protein
MVAVSAANTLLAVIQIYTSDTFTEFVFLPCRKFVLVDADNLQFILHHLIKYLHF